MNHPHEPRSAQKNLSIANKGPSSQSYGFPSGHVWIWELGHKESWTIMNWCFRTMLLEKTLLSPLDCKEIKPVNHKEINSEYSLEGLMLKLKLKLQYFGHLMRRTDSLVKTLMLGKIEGRRRREWQRMRWLDGITNSMAMNLSKLWDSGGQGSLIFCSSWGQKESDMTCWLNSNSNWYKRTHTHTHTHACTPLTW